MRYNSIPDGISKIQILICILWTVKQIKIIHYPDSILLMPESSAKVFFFQLWQNRFSRVSEWRMPQIMSHGYRFNQFWIQAQGISNSGTDWLHMQHMFHTGADMIIMHIEKDLCFMF